MGEKAWPNKPKDKQAQGQTEFLSHSHTMTPFDASWKQAF